MIGDELIAATENDSVYALNRATGKTIWRANWGTPVPQSALNGGCGDIFPLGITGSPVYERGHRPGLRRRRGHRLPARAGRAVDAATGAVKLRRDLDSPTGREPACLQYQQRQALAIDDGREYAAFGGLFGDCGAYQGSVCQRGAAHRRRAPDALAYPDEQGRRRLGDRAGPVVGPNGDLWVSIGNGAAESGGRTTAATRSPS